MSQSQANWDEEIPYDPEAEYQALLRALRRKRGFGLYFVQCSPAEGEKIIQRVQTDLSQKRIEVLKLEESLEQGNFYERVETFLQAKGNVEILFIQGLEYSLYDYEETKKRLGWSSEEIYAYSWQGVPRILSHLNQQRERFRDNFNCSFVFLVPLFVVKYFIQRAPDFFDWRSGIFQFPRDPQEVAQESQQVLLEGDYQKYLTLSCVERWQKILHIRELLESPRQTTERKDRLLFELGNLFVAENDYENAIAAYDQALLYKPDYYKAWYNKGTALSGLGCKEDAIAAYDQALLYKPDYYKAWYNKGTALYALGQHEDAIAAYDQALHFKPDYHEAWYNEGVALYALGRHEDAIAAYDQVIAIKSDEYKAWDNRGDVLVALKQYKAAVENFDRAIAINPSNRFPHQGRGFALMQLGRYPEALESFDRAIELNPDYERAHYNKACCFALQGDLIEAIASLSRAIELDPENRELAKTDTDFDSIRDEDWFQAVVEGEDNERAADLD